MDDAAMRWSARVVRGEVRGRPCLVYPDRPTGIGDVLAASSRWADQDFLVQGDRRITFGAHRRAVHRVAAVLRARSVGRGDRVVIVAPNSPEWVVCFLATMSAGAIAVPGNGWWSAAELADACAVVAPTLVIVDEDRTRLVPEGLPILPVESLAGVFADDADLPGHAPVEVAEDDPALILFTSGTTGRPKGAVLSHRALCANLQNLLVVSRRLPAQLGADHEPSATLVVLPLFHIGAIQLTLVPLVTGSRLVFLTGRFDAAEVADLVEHERITMMSAVPTMMERLLPVAARRGRRSPALRTIVLGGAPVSAALIERVRRVYPNARRGIGHSYGLTEACGVVSSGVAAGLAEHPGSVGRVMPVVEVDCGGVDGAGPGELLVRGPTVMHGYWGHPPDEVIDADGWLRTGDLGRIEDGHLYLTGRIKDVIIRGGENVSAVRVEERLVEHPRVREAAVLGLPHPDLGEEVGAVVVVDDPAPSREELAEHCRAALGRFQVPSRWWLRAEPLPTNEAGKVVKYRLRDAWGGDGPA